MLEVSYGICPVCSGSGHMPCPNYLRKDGKSHGWYGYREYDDTITCTNCGGQTMYGKPSGKVRLREDGTPCVHEYDSREAGRCYTIYTCKHCKHSFDIDSGD